MKSSIIKSLAGLIATAIITGCGQYESMRSEDSSSSGPAQPAANIVQVAEKNGNFTTLIAALRATGLDATLKTAGPFTVFAPTDEAFAKLPHGTLQYLIANPAVLTKILLYHVVSGSVNSTQVTFLKEAQTVEGRYVRVNVRHPSLYINESKVILADVIASNGIIHVIDTVLTPPVDIIETARAAGGFTTLLAAVSAAGLTNTLKGGSYTVFAPTDAAFAALWQTTINSLLANIPLLTRILLYHVISGKVDAQTASTLTTALTAAGQHVSIRVTAGQLYINNSRVITKDIYASNGIIHVIDAVLIPN